MNAQDVVVPGEPLAVEEEAIPVQGAYLDSRGFIRSLVFGLKVFDKYRKQVYVKQVKTTGFVKPGSVVEAYVEAVSDDIAFLRIYSVEGQGMSASGVLHVSQASNGFVQSLLDVVRPGDYVKAKVLNNSIPYQLTLKEPDLGVVEAYCSVCGGLLYRSGDVLVCSLCGNREKRKTSLSYIHVSR
ncbi:exosome complex RNA-binding protein Csl4 [Desulfurococcus mucosus]|uniref:Exosome complex component Csl4 n=1 Tax=Desulfurococcus mucosus (strain ATCC 35584 / DSM 2162 / JCM 9187 / O7/1) TaxID=765177 RepID=E8RAE8_DESM0|nr:exosome complex RNA-binding protein Csl4 [Desulfurococcus mucosus]ADV64358.1 RNA-binding protein (consists of S1 domain and a Zn-ribbon domain) [Desulfurococcus mucosus DSM 2162]